VKDGQQIVLLIVITSAVERNPLYSFNDALHFDFSASHYDLERLGHLRPVS